MAAFIVLCVLVAEGFKRVEAHVFSDNRPPLTLADGLKDFFGLSDRRH